ncbi:MAG TPA: hexosyltransferase, partial [Planctomycetaceae bacterium]|nr:hexosyltransferase [Planctomycetaceae bacterium]
MHDNTWARSLKKQGAQVTLLPTYTPLRLDEHDESSRPVFLGGINVYLDFRARFWRAVPRVLTRWLDRPAVIHLATRFGVSNNAQQLGELTLAMLAGESGPQSREIAELAAFLGDSLRPDTVCFSNALLVGAVRSLRQKFAGRIFCILQGDDIFLEDLHEPY